MNTEPPILIRPIRPEDAESIHAMRIMPGVQETISSIYTERVTVAEDFINSLSSNDFHLVAVPLENQKAGVIGSAGLQIDKIQRRRHVALLGIMIHTEWQGRGVGRKLMERLIDLADNWLMLNRLELKVLISNEQAIHLYQSFGFEIEGTMRAAIIQNGVFADMFFMGRVV